MKKLFTVLNILIVFILFSACKASSDYMIKTNKSKNLKLSSHKSRVVFIRPSSFAFAVAPAIITDDGKYIGEPIAKSYCFSDLDPGNHTFIVWGEGTHAMKANLRAGRTYYVKVTAGMGAWQARLHLNSIKKNSPDWKLKNQWLKDLTLYIPDMAEGQKMIKMKSAKEIKSTIEKGKGRFAEYTNKEKKLKTLFPEDGV